MWLLWGENEKVNGEQMDVKITERGWAGHFICSDRCKFRRNTLIEYGDTKWVVSTVGCFVCENRVETIGLERFYETMAFEAKEDDGYWEADVSKGIFFDSNWTICAQSWEQLVTNYPNVDNDANNMHDTVVKELSEKIKLER